MKHDARNGWCICGERHDGRIPNDAPLPSVATAEGVLGRDVRETDPRKDKPTSRRRSTTRARSGDRKVPGPLPVEFRYQFGVLRF